MVNDNFNNKYLLCVSTKCIKIDRTVGFLWYKIFHKILHSLYVNWKYSEKNKLNNARERQNFILFYFIWGGDKILKGSLFF